MTPEEERTRQWVTRVVVGCNFCPFAARELKRNAVEWKVHDCRDRKACLATVLPACARLVAHPEIETTLLIFPHAVPSFEEYLDLTAGAQRLLKKGRYVGVFQLATFHPLYRFSDAPPDDPANYTNRSPFPILQLLREDSLTRVLEHYPDPEEIPRRNVAFARAQGLEAMRALRDGASG